MQAGTSHADILKALGRGNREFLRALEWGLVDGLLAQYVDPPNGSRRWRCVDGLLFEHTEADARNFFGIGMVMFLPAMEVEPISVRLHWRADGAALADAEVKFGAPGFTGFVHGSREHARLAGRLLTNPHGERDWSWRFRLTGHTWSAERGVVKGT